MNKKTGTREWSDSSLNIGLGCSHSCLYCYARIAAYRRGKSRVSWPTELLALPSRLPTRGVVMFPTTHDITPYYLPVAIDYLGKILAKGAKVLIVTKAHYACVVELCQRFGIDKDYRKQILWRFTIGTLNEKLAAFWEPGAPTIEERFRALKFAHHAGFSTSVSMEPMLAGADHALITFGILRGKVTEKIWIGKMNKVRQRVAQNTAELREACLLIEHQQCDPEIRRLYAALKDEPKVAWKDSIKQVIGL